MARGWVKRGTLEAARWVREGWIGWLAFLVALLILIGLHFLPTDLDRRLAIDGTLFQLIGLGCAAFGIGRLRRYFNLEPVWKSILKYIIDLRYIVIARPANNLHLRPLTGVATLTGGAAIISTSPPGTVDEKIKWLEKKLNELQLSCAASGDEIGKAERKLRAEIKQEIAAREAGELKAADQLKETAIGDWQLEIIGVAYLIVGIILGTVPSEIAQLMLSIGFI
jgi:hypothetical protein